MMRAADGAVVVAASGAAASVVHRRCCRRDVAPWLAHATDGEGGARHGRRGFDTGVNGAEDDRSPGVIGSEEFGTVRAVGGGGGDERLGGVASSGRVPTETESGSTAQTGMPFDYICPLYGRRDRPPPPSSDLPSISNRARVHCSSPAEPSSLCSSLLALVGSLGSLSVHPPRPTYLSDWTRRPAIARSLEVDQATRASFALDRVGKPFWGVRYTVGVGMGTAAPPLLLLG
uniref:Uncharacterized protein n=1 Tax=Plectus sambesii TaxID=2011161 RepID=A0A914WSR3_9BILA